MVVVITVIVSVGERLEGDGKAEGRGGTGYGDDYLL